MGKVDAYVHAALILHSAGKEITAENILAVVKAAGIEGDEAKAKVLAEALKGQNIEELLEAPVVAVSQAAPQPTQQEEKKEEKPQEDEKKSEEEAAAGLAGLFG